MTGLTEERIREIVREEIAAKAAESAVESEASAIAFRALMAHRVETLMDEIPLPDREREVLERYFGGLLGD